jgi:hypothetical protein
MILSEIHTAANNVCGNRTLLSINDLKEVSARGKGSRRATARLGLPPKDDPGRAPDHAGDEQRCKRHRGNRPSVMKIAAPRSPETIRLIGLMNSVQATPRPL